MNALANEEVGKFLNKHFVSSFQKVGTFKIANGQKQGGNVAAYFCAPDGRVLHAVAGPVDAKTFLEQARWAVDKTREAIVESKGDASKFKNALRKFHSEQLLEDYGLKVTPVLRDQGLMDLDSALAYRDRDGKRLAPKLPLPPIEGRSAAKGGKTNSGGALGNDAKIRQLLAGHATAKIETLYGSVFEGILGEKVSTRPVQADRPFTWVKE